MIEALPFRARCFAGALIASTFVIGALMIHNRLVLTLTDPGFVLLVAVLAGLGTVRYAARAGRTLSQARWRDFSENMAMMITICVLGVVASYEAAADTTGFADAALARSDRLLHFDWVSLYRLVAAHPLLQRLGAAAYATIFLSPTLLLGWMAWHGERHAAHRFLATFWLAAVLTLVLFPLLPARGPLAFLWHGPIHYMPTSALYQSAIIPGLRTHAVTAIDLATARGLVCAPSFHTASAVVYMAAGWSAGRLRLLVIPVNVAMLLATPVEGTHYLIDMILGALVAILAIVTVRLIARRLEQAPATPEPATQAGRRAYQPKQAITA